MALDETFFQELESKLTSIGTKEVWKRKVGDVLVWMSPTTFSGQSEVRALIESAGLGPNVIFESKRKCLSQAIVGLDDVDLTHYREAGPIFPVMDPRLGKPTKVTLSNYIYFKMSGWGDQFISDLFDVFTDLMGSHEKNNLKEIQFENTRDPREEHDELYGKIIELRQRMGLPDLIESTSEPQEVKEDDVSVREPVMENPTSTPSVDEGDSSFTPMTSNKSFAESLGVKVSHEMVDDGPIEKKSNIAPKPELNPEPSVNPRFNKKKLHVHGGKGLV